MLAEWDHQKSIIRDFLGDYKVKGMILPERGSQAIHLKNEIADQERWMALVKIRAVSTTWGNQHLSGSWNTQHSQLCLMLTMRRGLYTLCWAQSPQYL